MIDSRVIVIGVWVCVMGLLAGCNTRPRVTVKREELAKLRRIAVLSFTDAPGADAGDSGKVVSSMIAGQALGVPGWTVVERQRIAQIVGEHDLQSMGITDPRTAVRIGKLVGADGVILGDVAQYRIGSIPFLFMFTFDQDLYKVGYNFRVVAVETGQVCVSAHVSRSSMVSFEQAISEGASQVFDIIKASRLNWGRNLISD